MRESDRPGRSALDLVAAAGWGVVALVPLVAGAQAIAAGWTAIADQSMMAAVSLETLTTDPPLVGMPTSFTLQAGRPLYHPGPLLFWLLAIPDRVFGEPGYGMIATAVAVNSAALAACFAVFRRANRPLVTVWASVLVVGLMHAFGGLNLRDPFNPSVALLPLLAAFLATWSVLTRHPKALLLVVGFGSFAAQSHVTNLPLFAGLLPLAAAALFNDWRRLPSKHPGRRIIERWSLRSTVLLALCWIGPILDQVTGGGNLWGLATAEGNDPPIGLVRGLERLLATLAPVPAWLSSPDNLPAANTSGGRSVAGAVSLALVGAVAVWAARAGRRDLLALAVAALWIAGLAAVTTGRLPDNAQSVGSPINNFLWLPVTLLVWLALTWGLAAVAAQRWAPRLPVSTRWPAGLTGVVVAIAAVVLVIAGATATLIDHRPSQDPGSVVWGAARQHATAIARATPAGSTAILIPGANPAPAISLYIPTLVGQLRLQGVAVRWSKRQLDLGVYRKYRETGREQPTTVFWVRSGPDAAEPVPGYRVISRYDPAHPLPKYRGYDTTLFLTGRNPSAVLIREEGGAANP